MTAQPRRLDDRAKELFAAALARPEAERSAFLAQACGADRTLQAELLTLLRGAVDAEDTFCEAATPAVEASGDRIGHYRLLQRIGEGGFGSVWMAEQEQPVRRRVALKVLKAGMDTAQVVGRFEAERQALALMDHPNIARVFDGGATAQGRPYFVMELVKGVPITRYCDDAGLPMAERLQLFVQVCHAVQHAHQKGVIHRDLKPSNVLVTLHDGVPVAKVIDFGIAKATAAPLTTRTVFTEFRQMLGTPEYMAPEQAELSGLDVDTRADIYSLGVLLYELLTGTRPFDLGTLVQAGFVEMLRTIKEVEPPKPSTRVSTLGDQLLAVARHRQVHPRALGALMRGDLDWIVMKALEKDRGRRYGTATALAEDVLRHLHHEPVLAGPPDRVYRLGKYLRRHRVAVSTAAVVVLALLTGLLLAADGYADARLQAERAGRAAQQAEIESANARREAGAAVLARNAEEQQRRLAEAREQDARRANARANHVIRMLEHTLASSNPFSGKGRNYPVRELLAEFERELTATPDRDPMVEATARRLIGKAYLALGMGERAEPHLRQALALRQERLAPEDPAILESWDDWLNHTNSAGRFAEVAQRAADLLAEWSQRGPVPWPYDTVLRYWRFDALRSLGRHAEALPLAQEAEALARSHGEEGRRYLADLLTAMGRIHQEQGRHDAALDCHRQALALARAIHGGDHHPDVGTALNNLGMTLGEAGRFQEAEKALRKGLEVDVAVFGEDSVWTASPRLNLAKMLDQQARPREAEPLHVRVLELIRSAHGDAPRLDLAQALNNRGNNLVGLGRLAEAEEVLVQALAIRRQLLPARHKSLAVTLGNLGHVHEHQRRVDLAWAELSEALDIERGSNTDPADQGRLLASLGRVAHQRGDLDTAERYLREALEVHTEHLGEDSPVAGAVWTNLGSVLRDRRDLAGAEAAHRRALAIACAARGERSRDAAIAHNDLGGLLIARRDPVAAERELRLALTIHQEVGGPRHPEVATAAKNLAVALSDQDRDREAVPMYELALAIRRERFPADSPAVASVLSDFGALRWQLHELDAAQTLLNEALTIYRRGLGETHPDTARAEDWLAAVHSERGEFAPAEALLRQALTTWERMRPGHPERLVIQCRLAVAMASQGRHAEAEPLALAACQDLAGRGPGDQRYYHDALSIMVKLYTAMARPDAVAEWQARLQAATSRPTSRASAPAASRPADSRPAR